MTDLNDFLEHHGVKGMHWGVRSKKPPTRKELSSRSQRQKLSDRRRQLSDSDLKTFVERLSNEKKLKTLVEEDLSPGKAVAKKIMSQSGQKIASTVVAGAGFYAIKLAFDRKFNPKEAADFIVRGGIKKK